MTQQLDRSVNSCQCLVIIVNSGKLDELGMDCESGSISADQGYKTPAYYLLTFIVLGANRGGQQTVNVKKMYL